MRDLFSVLWQLGWEGRAFGLFLIGYALLIAYGAFIILREIMK